MLAVRSSAAGLLRRVRGGRDLWLLAVLRHVGLCPGHRGGRGLEDITGADLGEQAGALGYAQGRVVHMGDAEGDVPGVQVIGQLFELFGAGDVEIIVGVQVKHHGVDRASRTNWALA